VRLVISLEGKVNGKDFLALKEAPCHYYIRSSGGIAPSILNLNTGLRLVVVSLTPRPLYLQESSPQHGPRASVGGVRKRRNPFPEPVGNRTLVVQPVA